MRKLQNKIILKPFFKEPNTVSVLNVRRKRIEEFWSVRERAKNYPDISSAWDLELTRISCVRRVSFRQ